MDTIEVDDDSATAVTFKSGVHFNFTNDIAIKTTRIETDSELTSPERKNKPKPPQSILRSPSDSLTVNSDITTESRLKTLESGMEQILKFVQRQPDPVQPPQDTNQGCRLYTSNAADQHTGKIILTTPPRPKNK